MNYDQLKNKAEKLGVSVEVYAFCASQIERSTTLHVTSRAKEL